MLRILVIDDEPLIRRGVGDHLRDVGHDVTVASDGSIGIGLLRERKFDLIISDVRMPNADGFAVFRTAREEFPSTDIILMTAHAEVEHAVEAMRAGAHDYLTKPIDLAELEVRVERLEQGRSLHAELAVTRERLQGLGSSGIVGKSDELTAVVEEMMTMAPSDAPVLVTGETGTGKELIARSLHQFSDRSDGPFVAVNCSAFPETLIEAELFGYEEGAFTGATRSREGRFEAAHRGTPFLDEVAELPLAFQAKLLRVLESGEFERLGSNACIKVDVRLVSATHRDLRKRIAERLFREDLFFRINVLDLHIPPLRERTGDIPVLAKHFLARFTPPGTEPAKLTDAAWQALLNYQFPGNVRELMHAVHRALILAGGSNIELGHLPQVMRAAPVREESDDVSLKAALRTTERQHIQRILRDTEGRKGVAAARLGVSRKTLWEKIRLHGLGEPSNEQ